MFVSDFPHSHACPRHNDALRMNDHPHDRGVYSEHPGCMSNCLQDMLLQLLKLRTLGLTEEEAEEVIIQEVIIQNFLN
jgi:hypothetical protein